jgi:dihydropteroate synthase
VRVNAALEAGIAADRVIIDPGLGFAKTGAHNWALLARLRDFVDTGHPVLVGASRKTFLGDLLADPATGERRPPEFRDAATAALSTVIAMERAWCVRVHEVTTSLDAVRVAARLGAEIGP